MALLPLNTTNQVMYVKCDARACSYSSSTRHNRVSAPGHCADMQASWGVTCDANAMFPHRVRTQHKLRRLIRQTCAYMQQGKMVPEECKAADERCR
jgi:hypothetical protein